MRSSQPSNNDRPVTHDTDRGIQGYVWAHDNRHLMYVRGKDASENFRLYDVDLQTGIERDLTPMDGVSQLPDKLGPTLPLPP